MGTDEFEDYLRKEEWHWELWLRLLMLQCMPSRDMYEEWLRIRANRTPEDWYGSPE